MKNLITDLNNKVYRFCNLLKIDCIKKELEEYIIDYSIKSIELKNGEWNCSFDRENNDDTLVLGVSRDNIHAIKIDGNFFEAIRIDRNYMLSSRTIEKRPNGIIYSVVYKQFLPSNKFENKFVLADLVEYRYVLTNDKLKQLLNNIDFDNKKETLRYFYMRKLENKFSLVKESDFYSEFSTHMNYYHDGVGGRRITNNFYPTKTYLNEEDVSNIFDVYDGEDKLYRVYDLYRGIINPRNEKEIKSMNVGFLPQDAYDLRTLRGITEKEDMLVGGPLKKESDNYINYLKEMLFINFGYMDDLTLDRNSILSGITYKISGPEYVKRETERKLGIPYEEYEKLNIDEQIDKLTESGPKRLLRKIIKIFKNNENDIK